MRYVAPKNTIKIQLSPAYIKSALVAATAYDRLTRGDLSVVIDMARQGQIALGEQTTVKPAAEAITKLEVLMEMLSNKWGFPALGIAYPSNSPLLKQSTDLFKLCKALHFALMGEKHSAAFGWDTYSRVKCGKKGFATFTLTWTQAKYLSNAAEFFTRMSIGQLEAVIEAMRQDEVPLGETMPLDIKLGIIDFGDSAIRALKKDFGHPANGSLGIGNRNVSKDAHLAWELRKEIAQKLAILRDPNPSFKGVDYDGNLLRYTDEPLPVVEVLDTDIPGDEALPGLEDILGKPSHVDDRFITFYAPLAMVPAGLPESEYDARYEAEISPFMDKVIALVQERADSSPARMRVDHEDISSPMWECCEPSYMQENRNGYVQTPIEFVVHYGFGRKQLQVLKTIVEEVIAEVGKELNLPCGDISCEVTLNYTGTATTQID